MQPAKSDSSRPDEPRRRPPLAWLWFFAFLVVAGVSAIVTPVYYNLHQQLQPEQFEAARARWKQNGPLDYDLSYEVKQAPDPRPDHYFVVVRGGRVQLVLVNQDLLLATELATPLGAAMGATLGAVATERVPERQLTGYTVEGLFHTIDVNLQKNAESEGRNFATASFDPKDGHPIHYIYRVKRSSERLEWNVKLVRP